MLGFGMIIPILPFYIESFGASGSALGILMAVYATAQFLFAPIWGQLSDRYGRKPILMVGVLGNAIAQILFALSTQLWMLYAARALAGILSSATLPTAMAYIGDSTHEKDRGAGMGILGAAMGVGMVLGPGLGGWFARTSLSLPFLIAGGMSLVALILVFLILPESLPQQARNLQKQGIQAFQLRILWDALSSPIGFLLFLAFLLSFAMTNFEAVFGLYTLEKFGYGPAQVGALLTFIGLTSALIQGALTGPLTRRWGEEPVIKASLLTSAIGFVLMVLAESTLTVVLTVGFFVISNSMLRPVVSSLTSRRSTVGQGVAMGFNNSFMSLGRIVGPLWAGYSFDLNLSYPYLSGAVVMFLGFVTCLIWLASVPSQEAVSQEVQPTTQM